MDGSKPNVHSWRAEIEQNLTEQKLSIVLHTENDPQLVRIHGRLLDTLIYTTKQSLGTKGPA